MDVANLDQKLAAFSEHWQPRAVGQFNGLLIEPTGTPNTGHAATAAPRHVV